MGVLQVIANRAGTGKTCFVSALLVDLIDQGKKAAYFKPFSANPDNDPDIAFVSQGLLPEGTLPPVPNPQAFPDGPDADPGLPDGILQGISETVRSLASQADVTLVEGPDLVDSNGAPSPPAARLASSVDARVVLLLQWQKGSSVGNLAAQVQSLGDRLAGVVLNGCPIHRRREITQSLLQPMKERGIPVWGAIPEDRFMLAVTVQQIAEHLGGTWVQEPVNTQAPVDRFLIGGNIMDSGPNYFGRYQNQAVITRAGRPDIQLASLMCETKCLVLTEGDQPSEYIRVEADKKGVPLISVEAGTISTADALEGLLERANSHSRAKADRFGELMRRHLDQGALSAAMS